MIERWYSTRTVPPGPGTVRVHQSGAGGEAVLVGNVLVPLLLDCPTFCNEPYTSPARTRRARTRTVIHTCTLQSVTSVRRLRPVRRKCTRTRTVLSLQVSELYQSIGTQTRAPVRVGPTRTRTRTKVLRYSSLESAVRVPYEYS